MLKCSAVALIHIKTDIIWKTATTVLPSLNAPNNGANLIADKGYLFMEPNATSVVMQQYETALSSYFESTTLYLTETEFKYILARKY